MGVKSVNSSYLYFCGPRIQNKKMRSITNLLFIILGHYHLLSLTFPTVFYLRVFIFRIK